MGGEHSGIVGKSDADRIGGGSFVKATGIDSEEVTCAACVSDEG